MKTKNLNSGSSRRKFLTKQLPVGALMCLGCKNLLSSPSALINPQEAAQKAKYLKNSGMSTEDVFKFTYNNCVPIYKNLGSKIGKEKFFEMLKEAAAKKSTESVKSLMQGKPGDVKSIASMLKTNLSNPPYDNAISYVINEESGKVFEIKYTECLVAKLHRDMNAADIGYATECSMWDAIAKAFNPKMAAKNPKNIMNGDDVCIMRFTMNA
jgi:hypothetical protein